MLLTVLGCCCRLRLLGGGEMMATGSRALFSSAGLVNLFILIWFVVGAVWLAQTTAVTGCDGGVYGAVSGFWFGYVLVPFALVTLGCTGCCCLLKGSAPAEEPAEKAEAGGANA